MKFLIDGTEYPWDQRLLFTEAKAVKAHLGMKVSQWEEAIEDEDIEALGMLAWLAVRRAKPDAPDFEAFDFDLASFDTIATEAEKAAISKAQAAAKRSQRRPR
jgi:hypothetical protein